MLTRLFAVVALALAAQLQNVMSACAQDWPSRTMTLVYPFGAGSSADILARLLAARLQDILGQPVVVENVAGAGGMTGSNRVAKAAPDGYQFVLGGTFMTLNQSLYKHPLYNVAADFAPVALVAELPAVLITRKDLPANNLTEFIAYAKANEAKMQYGSPGVGSAPHLTCALLNAVAGINVTHVPYRNTAQPIQEMIAGRIDYFCPLAALAIPQIKGNAVKGIATFSRDRLPVLPNLASAREQGFPNLEVLTWYGLLLPKNTSAPIVARLHDATIKAMATPAVQEQLAGLGYTMIDPDRRSSVYFQKLIETEIDRWGAVIKAAGVTPVD
jgi:tripartite-type tricarboxylate transporter receptor subunit TctC